MFQKCQITSGICQCCHAGPLLDRTRFFLTYPYTSGRIMRPGLRKTVLLAGPLSRQSYASHLGEMADGCFNLHGLREPKPWASSGASASLAPGAHASPPPRGPLHRAPLPGAWQNPNSPATSIKRGDHFRGPKFMEGALPIVWRTRS